MVKPIHKNLRIRTFAAVMLLNFLVILLIFIFFQQRSLSFFEREFAATLYEQAFVNEEQAFVNEMNAFAKAIKEGTETPVTGEDGLYPVEMAAAATKSLKEGRPVKIEEVR